MPASNSLASVTFLLIIALGAATVVCAQLVGGAIQGTVKDVQNAVLPGASIVVRNAGTGASYEQTTDASGRYLGRLKRCDPASNKRPPFRRCASRWRER